MDAKRIGEIRERCEKATPPPWTANDVGEFWSSNGIVGQCYDNVDSGLDALDDEQSDWNTRLISHAPDDLRDLLAHVEALEALIGNVERLLGPVCRPVVGKCNCGPCEAHRAIQQFKANAGEAK